MSTLGVALFTSFAWWFAVMLVMSIGGRNKAIEYGIWEGTASQWVRLALVNAGWPVVLTNAAMKRGDG